MGKRQQNEAENMAKENYGRVVKQTDQTNRELTGRLPAAFGEADSDRANIRNTYSGMVSGRGGGMDSGDFVNLQNRLRDFQSSGGFGDISGLRGRIGGVADTGGYGEDASRLYGKYNDLGGMGGIDPSQVASIRAGYSKLADTGGIDESTADAMRRQTASGVQSVYSTLGSRLARTRAAQGGAGGQGETAQMARQLANKQAEAITGVNAQIGQLRQSGTIAGLGGVSSLEEGIGSARRGAIAGEQALAGDVAAGRRQGVGMEQGLESNIAANRLQATGQEAQNLAQEGLQRIQAAGGLERLYQAQPGYVSTLLQNILQNQGMQGTLTSAQTQILAEMSKNPGLYQDIMQGFKTGAEVIKAIKSPTG